MTLFFLFTGSCLEEASREVSMDLGQLALILSIAVPTFLFLITPWYTNLVAALFPNRARKRIEVLRARPGFVKMYSDYTDLFKGYLLIGLMRIVLAVGIAIFAKILHIASTGT